MTRIDRLISRRLGGSVGLTLAVLFGIAALFETLKTDRLAALNAVGGPLMALGAILTSSAQWTLEVLPQGVLIGMIVGLVGLQQSREMVVIKGSGVSIWRLMRAPMLGLVALGLLTGIGIDTLVVTANRALSPGNDLSVGTTSSKPIWLEERGECPYILTAGFAQPSGDRLDDVTVFLLSAPRQRIEAPSASLVEGAWLFATATQRISNGPAKTVRDYRLPTTKTPADLRARLASVQDLTLFEIIGELRDGLRDPAELAQTLTRLIDLLALPVALLGSGAIAFAFTAGYRRDNKYAATVLYGVVLGFVVYVLTELAARAGAAGVVDPVVAVVGPSVLAVLAGVTVLLYREDGRT